MSDLVLDKTQENALQRLLKIEPGEGARVVTAFCYIFILLFCWYLLRPIRESMGAGNHEVLSYLYTGTFLTMLVMVPLFGFLVSRYKRKTFIPVIYLFFFLNLVFFIANFAGEQTAVWLQRTYFIWASVFNLFVVSIFWSFMVDVFRPGQGRRLFGVIIAGGSVGALAGSLLTKHYAEQIGSRNLMILAALLLLGATLAAVIMGRFSNPNIQRTGEEEIGGGLFDGITEVLNSKYLFLICFLMLFHNFVATFLYNGMATLVGDSIPDFDRRNAFFANLNMWTQVGTFILQFFITSRLVTRFGIAKTALIVPIVLAAGLSLIGSMLTLALFAAVQVAQRSFNYGMVWPIKEMLFTVVPRSSKYKSKNFIDTFVYRGSDVTAVWVFKGLTVLGLSLQAMAWIFVPIVVAWGWVAWSLGKLYQRRTDQEAAESEATQ